MDDDGNIHVLDGQAQELRVFDAQGTYATTLARRGQGPGELARAEAIALLPDRRVVVRDPANPRVQVLSREPGQAAVHGPLPGARPTHLGGVVDGAPLG